jgi:hexokinase
MIINTEWGAFGENGELDFVLTKWDRRVDELSVNPGKQVSSPTLIIASSNNGLGKKNCFNVTLKWRHFSIRQIFEKMVSGMYMGELIRQVLVDLMRDDLIFFNCNREKILERGSFYTRQVRLDKNEGILGPTKWFGYRFASEIESDPVGEYTRARAVLQELEIAPDTVNDEDLSSLRLEKRL